MARLAAAFEDGDDESEAIDAFLAESPTAVTRSSPAASAAAMATSSRILAGQTRTSRVDQPRTPAALIDPRGCTHPMPSVDAVGSLLSRVAGSAAALAMKALALR